VLILGGRFLMSEIPLYVYILVAARAQQCPAKQAERKHGLSTEQFPVSAYVGISKNLKDLKRVTGSLTAALC